jgi:hypothetical protein
MCSRLILLCLGIRVFYFFMPKIPYIFTNNIINTIYICQFRCGRTNSTQKMRYEDILGHTSDAAKRKWFTTSWQQQNIETECLILWSKYLSWNSRQNSQWRLRYFSLSVSISLQNKFKKRLDNWEMLFLQCDNTLQRLCAIFLDQVCFSA